LSPIKTIQVLGEPVELLQSGEMTNGMSAMMLQVSQPGGGPPPHKHTHEDELFFVVQGEYEFLRDGEWIKVAQGESAHAQRGSVHAFRNCGTTEGRMLFIVTPSGLERYFEELAAFSLPQDMEQIKAVSARYGITLMG
jgi:quercetin dioxygenase-like cupin family protein